MAVDKDQGRATIQKTPLFRGLSEVELGFLLPRIVQKRASAGEIIFSEGDPCAGLYVVQSGNLRIFKVSASGREQVLAIEGPGSSVAELPVFDGGAYPASAQAVNDCTLLFLSKQEFQALCLKYPRVALKVLAVVGSRLRRLVAIIEELSFTTVRHRLIAMLLRMAQTEGERKGDAVTLTFNASNTELAAQIGTVRELVSRNLSRLQSEGLIAMDNRDLTIPSMAKLQSELENSGA
ncbi:MAG TPA: Crp/Fnr family transcriptional regulator [Candidatus Koribacter sp.]|jgi:CRP/FNR family transcriptional regulator